MGPGEIYIYVFRRSPRKGVRVHQSVKTRTRLDAEYADGRKYFSGRTRNFLLYISLFNNSGYKFPRTFLGGLLYFCNCFFFLCKPFNCSSAKCNCTSCDITFLRVFLHFIGFTNHKTQFSKYIEI